MADNIIKRFIEIFVKSDQAVTNLKDLETALNKSTTATENLNEAQEASGEGAQKVEESAKKAKKATEEFTEAKNKSASSSKNLMGALEGLGGGIGNVISSVKGLSKQLIILLANPVVLVITAIVGALALLYKAFTSTDAGAEKMDQIFSGLGATVDVLRDRLLKAAGAVAKFFSGDFTGAMEDARAAVSGIGDEIVAEFQKAAEATRILQELDDTFRDLSVSRAKLNRDTAAARELLTDENASYAQKKKALDDVKKAEQEQTASELAAAQKKLDAIKQENSLSDVTDEAKQKQADAEIALFGLQEKSASDRRKFAKQNAQIDREEAARKKELAKEESDRIKKQEEEAQRLYDFQQSLLKKANDAAFTAFEDVEKARRENELAQMTDLEAQEARINDSFARRIQAAKDAGLETLELEILQENELNQVRLDASEKDKARKDKDAEDDKKRREAAHQQKVDTQNAELALVSGFIDLAKGLGEKNKAIQKAAIIAQGAVSIASIIVNTEVGASKEVAKGGIFGLSAAALLNIKMALSIAAVVASTAKALQALGGGGAGQAGGTGSGSAAPTPAAQFNVVGQTPANQLAATLSGRQQVIKAQVVSSEVTSAQSLDRNRVEQSVFL